MARQPGPLGPGRSLHRDGYVKLNRQPFRNQWEHRVLSRDSIMECERRWPDVTWQVDHSDGRRAHNCRENLVLMDRRLNCALQRLRGRRAEAALSLIRMMIPDAMAYPRVLVAGDPGLQDDPGSPGRPLPSIQNTTAG